MRPDTVQPVSIPPVRLIWLGSAASLLVTLALIGAFWLRPGSIPHSSQLGSHAFLAGLSVFRADGAAKIFPSASDGASSASLQNACWSPDGQSLIVTRFKDSYNQGPSDLVRFYLPTHQSRVIAGDDEHTYVNAPGRCWDSTTDRIVFSSDRGDTGLDEIWTVLDDGTELRQVTHRVDGHRATEPVFSPDGSQIAFEVDRGNDDAADELLGQLFVIKADGSGLQAVISPASLATDDRLPSWSADGRLLFQRRVRTIDGWSDWDIFVVERAADGSWSQPRNVTQSSQGEETDASWSPDSQAVVTSSDYGGLTQPNIFRFPVSGGEPMRLTTSPDREDGAPSISPDGQWLAFESHRSANEQSPTDIWLKALSLPSASRSEASNAPAVSHFLSAGSFQWQLANLPVDTTVEADVFEIDGLDNPRSVVDELHAKGRRVICYVNVGAWEDFREDRVLFAESVLGKEYSGYPDERWLDIRQIDTLAPILGKRFDACRDKGFDAVEADNVDGFEQATGFPLTAADQLTFNRWVADQIHQRGMAAALKNDGTQATELLGDFDLVVTEECVLQDNCEEYAPFRTAGKLHLNAEYTDTSIRLDRMCTVAAEQGFTSILKHRALDVFRESCPQ